MENKFVTRRSRSQMMEQFACQFNGKPLTVLRQAVKDVAMLQNRLGALSE